MQETRCTAVVDGGMIITDAGVIVYDGVRPPRIGAPGAAYLRTVNQRVVQDRVVRFEASRRDRSGNIVAQVWAGSLHLNSYIPEQLAALDIPPEGQRGD